MASGGKSRGENTTGHVSGSGGFHGGIGRAAEDRKNTSTKNWIETAIDDAYKELTGQNAASRANTKTEEWINKILDYNQSQAEYANAEAWKMLEAQMRFNSAQAAQANTFSEKMWNQTAGFNSAEAEYSRMFSAEEAAKNREWQQYMSSTAHQREVADLKAAGLNPILSATGGSGAAMGQGAMGTTQEATISPVSGQMAAAALAQAQKANANIVSAAMENSSNALGLFGGLGNGLMSIIKMLVK